MNPKQRELIKERHQHFKNDVNPADLLPYLTCLVEEDKEEVECILKNHGPIRALSELLDRLKRRKNGFEQFVVGLRQNGLDHVALLLDPAEKVKTVDDSTEVDNGKFQVIGTAIDVKIVARIFDTANGAERNTEYEKIVAKEFEKSSNERSKQLRKAFKQNMPRGVVFVRTKQMGHALNLFSTIDEQMKEEQDNDKTVEDVKEEDQSKKDCNEKYVDEADETKQEENGCASEERECDGNDEASCASNKENDEDEQGKDETKEVDETEQEENGCASEERECDGNDEASCASNKENNKDEDDQGKDETKEGDGTKQEEDSCTNRERESNDSNEASCASSSPDSNGEQSDTELTNSGGDSISAIFRLTSVEHAEEFWQMYKSNELEKTLHKNLVLNTLIEKGIIEKQNDSLKLKLLFSEDSYKGVIAFFERIESEQSLDQIGDSLLSRGADNEQLSELDENVIVRIPQVCLESQRENIYKRNLKLREYQKELAGPALEGLNSIICAPTNSGKTFVAMEITKRHLGKYKKNDEHTGNLRAEIKGPKVIFIVSTQNLVLQQRTRFEEYLSKYSICDISGSNSTEIPLDFLLKTHDVIILTAQILLNALKKTNLVISQITLLIFDECHHTNKDHAYNRIMQRYMATKYLAAKDNRKLPQILGLTASLGVGKSTESEKAKNHILKICANMDATNGVSTVRKNTAELEKNVTGGVPKRRMKKVDQVVNVFEKVIIQIMAKIEKAAEIYYDSSNGVPADRVGQQYRQWVERLYKEAVAQANRDLVTYAQQLRRYHVSLIINDTVRIKDAMKYLDEFFDHLDESKFQVTDTKLLALFDKAKTMIESRKDKEPVNPKLQELKRLILEFHEEDKTKGRKGETKGILFTRTRDSTVGLQGWIDDTQELRDILRPKALVGAGDGEVGLTQGEQEAIIEEFKKGEVNILIATTVAEEGLDIGDCNFVIRYNMAGNEISSVQSRGRIRADEGNYVYVGDTRSKGLDREKLNQFREILMVIAVGEVQDIPQDCYIQKIESIQKKDVQNIKMKSILSGKKKRPGLETDEVMFFCRKCNVMACQMSQFRRLKDSFHVILDKTFVDEKVQLKPRKKSKKVDDILMETKVHCKNCSEDWGTTVKIDGFTWPCLKISAFAVEDPDSKRMTYKKWSEFPIEIPEAQNSEILEQDDTLNLDLDESSLELD